MQLYSGKLNYRQYTYAGHRLSRSSVINPLRPNIHIQILKIDLHTFSYGTSWENLKNKDRSIFPKMIILPILTTSPLDYVLILESFRLEAENEYEI